MTTLYRVDAFIHDDLAGNPAAVVPLEAPTDDAAWMQRVATAMGLSETAFCWPETHQGVAGWRLRWFTPAVEVSLCGHATLATSHTLWETGLAPAGEPIRYHTRSGVLVARPGEDGQVVLDFPIDPPAPAEATTDLAKALGVTPIAVHAADWVWLVEVADAATVRDAAPDFAALKAIAPGSAIVTATSDNPAYDVVSRFFGPGVGIDEDPVTGSAHCVIGPYWQGKLDMDKLNRGKLDGGKLDGGKLNRLTLVCHQASKRGGVIVVTLPGAAGANRVDLAGHATTVEQLPVPTA